MFNHLLPLTPRIFKEKIQFENWEFFLSCKDESALYQHCHLKISQEVQYPREIILYPVVKYTEHEGYEKAL